MIVMIGGNITIVEAAEEAAPEDPSVKQDVCSSRSEHVINYSYISSRIITFLPRQIHSEFLQSKR